MRFFIILVSLLTLNLINSQTTEENSVFIDKIYDEALSNGKSYEWLDYLSNQIGGRLSGSINYERSVKWVKEELNLLEIDSVWLQPVMVPKWVRGAPEYAHIETRPGNNILFTLEILMKHQHSIWKERTRVKKKIAKDIVLIIREKQ